MSLLFVVVCYKFSELIKIASVES